MPPLSGSKSVFDDEAAHRHGCADGLVHSVHTTAANVSDVTEAHRLLHGGETEAWGDAGYQGAEKRPEHAGSGVRWQVAMRPGLRRQLMQFLEMRIGDRRVLRLIRKWLNAGVIEAGLEVGVVRGTPQGAVISPLLANVYL